MVWRESGGLKNPEIKIGVVLNFDSGLPGPFFLADLDWLFCRFDHHHQHQKATSHFGLLQPFQFYPNYIERGECGPFACGWNVETPWFVTGQYQAVFRLWSWTRPALTWSLDLWKNSTSAAGTEGLKGARLRLLLPELGEIRNKKREISMDFIYQGNVGSQEGSKWTIVWIRFSLAFPRFCGLLPVLKTMAPP